MLIRWASCQVHSGWSWTSPARCGQPCGGGHHLTRRGHERVPCPVHGRRGLGSAGTGGAVVQTDEFEVHRDHLLGVAYRMLGSRAEAEDAVQEVWLRYATARPDDLADARGWLTTVTARICLDVLRSARVRRESYVGQWLPEPVVSRLPSAEPDPAERVARDEEVSLALLVVLDRLSPEQRVAFVLHDVFAVPFEEIAAALGTTAPAARQLASRA